MLHHGTYRLLAIFTPPKAAEDWQKSPFGGFFSGRFGNFNKFDRHFELMFSENGRCFYY